jgi:hypothetical protein
MESNAGQVDVSSTKRMQMRHNNNNLQLQLTQLLRVPGSAAL